MRRKITHQLKAAFLVASAFACFVGTSKGQSGVSSMSYGAANASIYMDPAAIKVEEFINYHRHQLPLPTEEGVHLDLRTGALPNGRIGLQVGLTTARAIDRELRKPLNLVMVIDRSGSMAGARLTKVKQSLRMLIEQLAPKDLVAIVSFSNSARIDLPSCHNVDMATIGSAIEKIGASGSTNLHGGLMLGYQQAKKRFDSERSNRVILLTDGVANKGTVDPTQIAKESRQFNKTGIELSTVGLGRNFNQELLRELASAGRGAVHFVDEAEGMQKIFVDEFDSLLSDAARKLRVKIDFGDKNIVRKIYGYAPENNGSLYTFKPDNMGHGATQVILAELERRQAGGKIKVKLAYHDCHLDEKVTTTLSISIGGAQEFSEDRSLRKNFTIGKVAHVLKRSAELCSEGEYEASEKNLKKSIKFAREHFNVNDDKDVDRILKLASKQKNRIREIRVSENLNSRSNRR